MVELPTSNVNSVFTTVIAICKRKSIQVLGPEGPTGLAILAAVALTGCHLTLPIKERDHRNLEGQQH